MAGRIDDAGRQGPGPVPWTRRRFMATALATAALAARPALAGGRGVSFGLTPVFLDSDIKLLAAFEGYLSARLRRPVTLVKRRTYQEITLMLLSGQLDAAWICGFPYVQYRDRLALVAVPLYRGAPLYQSYLIVDEKRPARRFEDLRGDVHAFSDPDSNSGFLVTRSLLALIDETPQSYFSRTFFTYGHRNVIRAVSSGLAQSGSVDGYVWDVMNETEHALVAGTRVIRKSARLGFPPVACAKSAHASPVTRAIADALLAMRDDPLGREILAILRLDGFVSGRPSLFDGIAQRYAIVKAQTG